MTVFALLSLLCLSSSCIFSSKFFFVCASSDIKEERPLFSVLSSPYTFNNLLDYVPREQSLFSFYAPIDDIRSKLEENSIALDTLISHLKDLCPQAGGSADPQKSVDYTSCETILKSPVIQLINVDKVDMSKADDSEQLKSLYPVFRAGAKFAYEAFINDRSWKDSVPEFQKYLKATCERERVLLKIFDERKRVIEMNHEDKVNKLFLRGVLSKHSHLELEKKIDLATWTTSRNFYFARDLVDNGCNFGRHYMAAHVKKRVESMRFSLIELLKQNDDFYKRVSDSPISPRSQAMIDRYMIRDMKRFSMISNALNRCTQKLIIENAEEYSSLNSDPTLEIIVDNFSLLKSYSTKFRHPLLDRIPEAIEFIEHAMYDLSSAIVPNTILYDKLSKKMDVKVNLAVESSEAIKPNFHLLSDKLYVLNQELKKFEPAFKLLDDSSSQTFSLEDMKRMASLVLAKQNVIQSLIRNFASVHCQLPDIFGMTGSKIFTKLPFFVYLLDENHITFDTLGERNVNLFISQNQATTPLRIFIAKYITYLNDHIGLFLDKFNHNSSVFDKLAFFPEDMLKDCKPCDSIMVPLGESNPSIHEEKPLLDQLYLLDQKVEEFEFLSQAFILNDQNLPNSQILEGVKFICERQNVLMMLLEDRYLKFDKILGLIERFPSNERPFYKTSNRHIKPEKCDYSLFPAIRAKEYLSDSSTQLMRAHFNDSDRSRSPSRTDLVSLKEALIEDLILQNQILFKSSTFRKRSYLNLFLSRNSYRRTFVDKLLKAIDDQEKSKQK